jgi:TRAP-type mannitol/chloroaromatic compound transport system permease small subunit
MTGRNGNTGTRLHGGYRVGLIARGWSWLVDGLAALGTILIGALMLLICADIVARNVMGSSLPLISELGALTLVMIVYLQLATTVRADRLARTEIFFTGFRRHHPVAGALLAAVFDLTGAVLVGLIAWSTVHILKKDFASGEFIGVPGIATLETWPFRAMILVGVAVAAVEFAVRAVQALRSAGSEHRS